MRIFCSLLIFFLATTFSAGAQELSGDSPWENNDSPWGNSELQEGPAPVQGASAKNSSTSTATGTTTMSLPKPKLPGTPAISTTPAPIDGGLVVLLAAGAAYGGKKLRKRNRQTA